MMDRKEILLKLKKDIEEHQARNEANKEHMVITDDWSVYFENSTLRRGSNAYLSPGYKNWVLISSNLSDTDREQVIKMKKEMYSISSELANTLLRFINSAKKTSRDDIKVFSSLLGAMEYVEEYFDKKMRDDYARFGDYLISGRFCKGDIPSWSITLNYERASFLDRIVEARVSFYRLLNSDKIQAKHFDEIDMESQIEKEIMASLKYRNSPCSIEHMYNNGMIRQGVEDFMILMRWEEYTMDTEKCESKE